MKTLFTLLPFAQIAILVGGCTTMDVEALQRRHADAEMARQILIEALAEAEAEMEIHGVDHTDTIVDLRQKLEALERYQLAIAAALRTAESGEIDPELQRAVGAIHPYASLAVALLGIAAAGWSRWERHRKVQALEGEVSWLNEGVERLVQSIEVALPHRSPQQKEVMRKVQGEKVTELVHEVKQEMEPATS